MPDNPKSKDMKRPQCREEAEEAEHSTLPGIWAQKRGFGGKPGKTPVQPGLVSQ